MNSPQRRTLEIGVTILVTVSCLIGFAALRLVDGISTAFVATFGAVLVILLNMRLVAGWTLPPAAARILNLVLSLVLVAVAVVVLPRGMASPEERVGVTEVGHVLVLLIVLRMAQRRLPRDDWFLLLGAAASLALTSFAVETSAFLTIVMAGAAVGTAAAFLLLFRGESRAATADRVTHDLEGHAVRRGPLRQAGEALFLGGRMGLVFLVAGCAAFLGIPRSTEAEEPVEEEPPIEMPPWPPVDPTVAGPGDEPATPVAPRRKTGFSDRIDIGDVAAIKKNLKIAFWASVYRDRQPHRLAPEDAYFRGEVLTKFDGRRWRTHAPVRTIAIADAARRVDWIELMTLPERFEPFLERGVRHFHYVEQEILLADMSRERALFALARPWLLDVGEETRFAVGPLGSLRLLRRHRPEWGYTVVSLQPRAGTGDPWRETVSPGLEVITTDVPPGHDRLAALATSVAGALGPSEAAARLAAELRTRCRYTLKVPELDRRRPLEDFVFRTGEGHCELFASAYAIMLRAVGIPSRLVVGFRGYELIRSETQELHQIRYSNAHAWVEAFLPGRGWTKLDPTPGDDQAGEPRAAAMEEEEEEEDVAAESEEELPWDEWVLEYDRDRQREIVEGAGEWVESVGEEVDFTLVSLVSLGLGLLGSAFFLYRFLRGRKRELAAGRGAVPRAAGPGGNAVRRAYLSMLGLLARRGIRRQTGETPREVARRVARALPEVSTAVRELTSLHQAVVYGDREAGRGDGRRAKGLVVTVRTGLGRMSA